MARNTNRYTDHDVEHYERPRRRTRPRTKERPTYDEAVDGMVVTVDRGRFTVIVDGQEIWAVKARPLGRKGVVVGDRVRVVGDTSGAEGSLARIVEVQPRSTVLRRTADDDDPVERVIVANASQLVIVTALADPEPRHGLIDRALVAAYDAGMTPLLCLTKADLADPETLLSTYRALGVPWVVTQRGGDATLDGVDELHERLDGRISVLLGHSGVGKSTLVNALVPDARREVGLVNAVTGRGRHTRHPVLRARARRPRPPHRGVPRPARPDRRVPAGMHPRVRRARVRARPGDRRRARPGGVLPAAARQPRPAGVLTPSRPGSGPSQPVGAQRARAPASPVR